LLAGQRFTVVRSADRVAAVAESHRGRSRGQALCVALAGKRATPRTSWLVPHVWRQHHP